MNSKVKFFGQLQRIRADKKYTARFNAAAQVLVRQAAREWLRALIIHIPVWTGFARGGIKFASGPNGNLSAYLNVAVPIVPISDRPRYYYHSNGGRIRKTPENGGRFTKYNFTSSNNIYRFSFRDDIVHFIQNEFFSSVSPTSPWRSLEIAQLAFNLHIKANLNKLPSLGSAFLKTNIEVK